MSTPIENNTTELEKLLEKANALPDAGTGGAVEEKDVNFFDFDGTLLYSYTLAEAGALNDLPPLPPAKREFYEPDCWNWTLEDIKDLQDPVSVSAIMKTKDDNTYVVVEILTSRVSAIKVNYQMWGGQVTINWGDGSPEETTTYAGGGGADPRTAMHEYQSTGEYVITIKPTATTNAGHLSDAAPFVGAGVNNMAHNQFAKEIYVGKHIRLTNHCLGCNNNLRIVQLSTYHTQLWPYALMQSRLIRAIGFPPTMKTIGVGALLDACYDIEGASLPKSVESIGDEAFRRIRARITIPPMVAASGNYYDDASYIHIANGITGLQGRFAYGNESITQIVIPQSINNIGAYAFYGCAKLIVIKFLPTSPPTVAAANAFTGIPTDCVIEVPAASLEAYQNATNYGGIAAQMIGV